MKFIKVLIIISSFLTVVFSLTIFWWLFYPYNVVDIKEPINIITKTVKAGEVCTFEVEYSKYMDIVGTRQFVLVDGMYIIIDEQSHFSILSYGKNKRYVTGFVVPKWYPAGRTRVLVIIKHQVNPIRIITERFFSEEFEVVQ